MVRAIFFDFYSVWLPDTIQGLLNEVLAADPADNAEMAKMVDHYYHGTVSNTKLAEAFRFKLQRSDIDDNSLTLNESSISPHVTEFMRNLHGHFVKLGVLANLGSMELELLQKFNAKQQLFEVIVGPLSLGSSQQLLSTEVFNKTLQLVGEKAANCVVVSGHDDYLQFASSLGMVPVKFDGMTNLSMTLEQILAKDLPSSVGPA